MGYGNDDESEGTDLPPLESPFYFQTGKTTYNLSVLRGSSETSVARIIDQILGLLRLG